MLMSKPSYYIKYSIEINFTFLWNPVLFSWHTCLEHLNQIILILILILKEHFHNIKFTNIPLWRWGFIEHVCCLFPKRQISSNDSCVGKETLWWHTCTSVDHIPISKTSHMLLEVISIKLIGSPR